MKPLARIFSFLGSLLALCGCSGADLLNAIIPHSGYSIVSDIAYGDNPRQKLDIYVPDNHASPAKTPLGVIVFFYGGSWQFGSRQDYRFAGQAFASKGYITVIPDYRLYPEVKYPAFVEDGARAFAWVHAHIGEYGGNPQQLYLAGHSAGGYIALMLTLNDRFIKAAGGERSWIKGAIGIAGPYDFLPFTDPKIKDIFSTSNDAATQPINYVSAGAPPVFLATGDDDHEVGPKNTRNLSAKLRQYGDTVDERVYPGLGHIGIVLSLAQGFRAKAPLLDDVDAFIRAHP